jgi:3-hydroxyacyl-[acyl-carrier-protein] dehydratase
VSNVKHLIPHREPFLFVDRIISIEDNKITTRRIMKDEDFFYEGHYPGMPITPGVILLEAMYQTGAIFISKQSEKIQKGVPVVTRTNNVKYKKIVKPGDTILIKVEFTEQISQAFCFKGKVLLADKVAASCEFICTIAEEI